MIIRFCLILLLLPNLIWADSRNPEFRVPAELRPRVDFWIGIFAKYTQQHAVFHHRDYPQAVFDVMDFNDVADRYGRDSVAYEVHVKNAKAKHEQKIKLVLNDLAKGRNDGSTLAQQISRAMEFVPGGQAKYQSTVREEKVRSQTGIKEKFADAIIRSGRYMPIIEDIFVREFRLPRELTRLPFVESSFDYKAYSSVGAAGIWQFMRATARSYMRVDNLIDERRDVISATRGAAKYLSSAYKSLGKWPLAVTSYNHGVGGVRKKVKQMGSSDLTYLIEHPTNQVLGFASNNFYPELLAAIEVYENYEEYFPEIEKEPALRISQHRLTNDVSVAHLSSRLGIGIEELKKYNYAIADAIWQGRYRIPRNYVLKVPAQYEQKLLSLNSPEPSSASSSIVYGVGTYRVRSGDSLGRVASKFGLTVAELKRINQLSSDRIHIGQVLLVNEEGPSKIQVEGDRSDLPTVATGEHLVKYRETLGGIASKYGMSISELRSLNNLRGDVIKEGQKLKVKEQIVPSSKDTLSLADKTYRVQSGDSLWSISGKFKVSITKIRQLNNLSGNTLKIGQLLKLQ